MQINFYILSQHYQLMTFVCQLVQTALAKTDRSVLIVADSHELTAIDDALWAFEPTAFIPHEIYQTENDSQHAISPVLISDNHDFAKKFDGILINLTATALLNSHAEKILEIIDPNPAKTEQGRQKYRQYQQYIQQVSQSFHQQHLSSITLKTFHIT